MSFNTTLIQQVLLFVIFFGVKSTYYLRSDWGSHQIVIQNANLIFPETNYSTNLQNYAQSGIYTYQNISKVLVILAGFEMNAKENLIYTVSGEYLYSNNSVNINLKLFGSTSLNKISLFVLITTVESLSYISMNAQYIYCGDKKVLRQNFSIAIHSTIQQNDSITVLVPIISINISLEQNGNRRYFHSFLEKIDRDNNSIILSLQTNTKSQWQDCYFAVIIFNQTAKVQNYLESYINYNHWINGSTWSKSSDQLSIPSIFQTTFNKKCAIGLFYAEFFIPVTLPSIFFFTVNNSYIINRQSNIKASSYSIICLIGYCPNNTKINYFNASINKCMKCSEEIDQCIQCESSSNCTLCQSNFVISYTAESCIACELVIANCINCTSKNICDICNQGFILSDLKDECITDCSSINHCLVCSSVKNCSLCAQGFTPSNDSESCICIEGWQVTKTCTTVVGCVTYLKYEGKGRCFFCDRKLHLILQNESCVCQKGYQLKQERCISKCGDSIIINEECDDGNIINGDGCSNLCIIQSGFICQNGQNCVQKINFQIELDYVKQISNSNSAQFIFKLIPIKDNLNLMNFTKYLSHNLSQLSSIEYKQQKLILYVSYNQTIQGSKFQLNISFDSTLFSSHNISYTFTALGLNSPLIMSQYLSQYANVSYCCYALVAILWLLFFTSLYVHNMIGLEMMYTVQTLCFSIFTIAYDQLLLLPLYPLKYINGINLLYLNDSINSKLPLVFCRFGFSSQFIINFILNLSLSFIAIIALIISQIKFKYIHFLLNRQQKGRAKLLIKFNSSKHQAQKVYYRIVYPFFMLSIYQFIFSLTANKTIQSVPIFSTTVNKICITFYWIFVLFFLLSRELTNFYLHEQGRKRYVSSKYNTILFIYTLVLVFLLLSLSPQNLISIYYVVIWVGFYTLLLIIWRPYFYYLHNIGIIFNQLIVLVFIGGLISVRITTPFESHILLFACMSMLGILIVFILSIYRIYMHWTHKKEAYTIEQSYYKIENLNQTKQGKAMNEEEINYYKKLRDNRYRYENQIIRIKEQEYAQINKERKELGFAQLYYDYTKEYKKQYNYYIPKQVQMTKREPSEDRKMELKVLKDRLRKQFKQKEKQQLLEQCQ